MWIIAWAVGILALISLSRADSSLFSSNIGWAIVALLMIDYSARSGLKSDVEKNGPLHNSTTTKTWIVIGIVSELLILILSVYTFIKS